MRRIIVLAFKNASFCLFENLFFVGIERHKRIHLSTKWVQLGRTLTSLFTSVYAGETLVLSTEPLAARGVGIVPDFIVRRQGWEETVLYLVRLNFI
ncbi:MAG: hypothetical protein DMG67_09325 [Acidobacteria bacterium]|nr:MAG: hypothetical protein DMG67_09325 [Acidobacteriota bacterium]